MFIYGFILGCLLVFGILLFTLRKIDDDLKMVFHLKKAILCIIIIMFVITNIMLFISYGFSVASYDVYKWSLERAEYKVSLSDDELRKEIISEINNQLDENNHFVIDIIIDIKKTRAVLNKRIVKLKNKLEKQKKPKNYLDYLHNLVFE